MKKAKVSGDQNGEEKLHGGGGFRCTLKMRWDLARPKAGR